MKQVKLPFCEISPTKLLGMDNEEGVEFSDPQLTQFQQVDKGRNSFNDV